ncbi:MAG: acetyl-CoA acetyltransferase, partial [Kiritimatiellia bacterium]
RLVGRRPHTPSGGLKSPGLRVGGTGGSLVVELVRLLRGEAEPGRQVKDPKVGLSVNFGGFGNNVVAVICAKE